MINKESFDGRTFLEQQECLALSPLTERSLVLLDELGRAATGRPGEEVLDLIERFGGLLRSGEDVGNQILATTLLIEEFEFRVRSRFKSDDIVRPLVEKVWILLHLLRIRLKQSVDGEASRWARSWMDRLRESLWSTAPGPGSDPETPGLQGVSTELRNAWVRRIAHEWRVINDTYLDSALVPPTFELTDSRVLYGSWTARSRTLAISALHILRHAWDSVLTTLKHEMAHQYVDEILRPAPDRPHGYAFQEACYRLRCDPSATVREGDLKSRSASGSPEDRILNRIQKLMELGGSPNQHEATAAMRKAGELLLKYNLEITARSDERGYSRRCVGTPLTRVQQHHALLSVLLSQHFFVQSIWIGSYLIDRDREARILEIVGTDKNLEIAEYVHDFLLTTVEDLWSTHRKSRDFRGGRKLQYFTGLIQGFMGKLDQQRQQIQESRALVWIGDSALEGHMAYLHPYTRRMSRGPRSPSDEYMVGLSQGREISLHRGVKHRSEESGKLLPASRVTRGVGGSFENRVP